MSILDAVLAAINLSRYLHSAEVTFKFGDVEGIKVSARHAKNPEAIVSQYDEANEKYWAELEQHSGVSRPTTGPDSQGKPLALMSRLTAI